MSDSPHRPGLYPALLKYWRRQRGLSQLDLASAAEVSSRHVSFLETGRSSPSAEMVLRLASTLGIPLRQVNSMLRSAGFDPIYDEGLQELPSSIQEALELLKSHHEPYPLMTVDRTYRIQDLNDGAARLLAAVLGDRVDPAKMNLARMTFDPNGAQPLLVNFDDVGRLLLWRIQREVLADPDDVELQVLLDELLAMPTVDPDWRHVDPSVPVDPAMVLHLRSDGFELRFLVTATAFEAPQNVAVEQLRIETWFPYDEATAQTCRELAGFSIGSS